MADNLLEMVGAREQDCRIEYLVGAVAPAPGMVVIYLAIKEGQQSPTMTLTETQAQDFLEDLRLAIKGNAIATHGDRQHWAVYSEMCGKCGAQVFKDGACDSCAAPRTDAQPQITIGCQGRAFHLSAVMPVEVAESIVQQLEGAIRQAKFGIAPARMRPS